MLLLAAAAACSGSPKPIVVHDTLTMVVALHHDPGAAVDRQHPASISPETIAAVLHGLRVSPRDRLGLGALRGQKDWTAAFTASEAAGLAPYLSQALEQARPHDVATFYVVSRDARLGRVITSGGLFVGEDHLYVILANHRTTPSVAPYEGVAYELDNRESPLIPIERYGFQVGFEPEDAWIRGPRLRTPGGRRRFLDEAKLVVIDLPRLRTEVKSGEPR